MEPHGCFARKQSCCARVYGKMASSSQGIRAICLYVFTLSSESKTVKVRYLIFTLSWA